jgi:hypothetical protein
VPVTYTGVGKHKMEVKNTFIILTLLVLSFSCNNKGGKEVEIIKSMNTPDKPISELKDLALNQGDIKSYEILETAYLDYASKNFIPIALEMAEKHNYPKAYQDVYWKMYSAQGLYEDDELLKWAKWNKKERSIALKYLILGALKGNKESIDAINDYYSIGKSLNQLIISDSLLDAEFSNSFIKLKIRKPTVLVLIPFDIMANAGRSPNISDCLESELSKNNTIKVIPFPYKKLMGVPYQQVFDKNYCTSILEKINVDLIIMSKLDNDKVTGGLHYDIWSFKIKIFDVKKNKQIDSQLFGNKITFEKVCGKVEQDIEILNEEIKKRFANNG